MIIHPQLAGNWFFALHLDCQLSLVAEDQFPPRQPIGGRANHSGQTLGSDWSTAWAEVAGLEGRGMWWWWVCWHQGPLQKWQCLIKIPFKTRFKHHSGPPIIHIYTDNETSFLDCPGPFILRYLDNLICKCTRPFACSSHQRSADRKIIYLGIQCWD